MKRDDVLRIAREVWGDDSGKPWSESALFHLEAFAKLVAAAEREACAKVCESEWSNVAEKMYGNDCALAIRARGEQK